jgi:hypothetical protein
MTWLMLVQYGFIFIFYYFNQTNINQINNSIKGGTWGGPGRQRFTPTSKKVFCNWLMVLSIAHCSDFVLPICLFCSFSYYLMLFDLLSIFLYKNNVGTKTFVCNYKFQFDDIKLQLCIEYYFKLLNLIFWWSICCLLWLKFVCAI